MFRRLPFSFSLLKKHQVKFVAFVLSLLVFSIFLVARQTGVFAAFQSGQNAQSGPDAVWQEVKAGQTNLRANGTVPQGQQAKTFNLDRNAMGRLLSRAPREFTIAVKDSPVIVSLPLADGKFARFRVVESNILDPGLAKQFPEIKSYSGQGVDDPTATMRFGWSPRGLSAMIVGSNYKATVLPPDARDAATYVSSFGGDEQDFNCGVEAVATSAPNVVKTAVGTQLRVYRMAIATSAGYLNDPQLGGGTIPNAVASLNGWLNAANAIYERELSVRLTLVNNTAIIGLTNITNTNEAAALGEIPPILGAMVGSANYDLGHIFISKGGGGIAGLGVVCDSGNQAAPRKGAGSTSFNGPVGNAGTTGVFVHEVGHMFGAPHTFNGTIGQYCSKSRSGNSGFEPGSGTTNMSYGGLCSQGAATDNISGGEKTRFHNRSFTAMANYIATGGGGCGVLIATGNQTPNVSGGGDFTIPKNTPFALTAVGSDPDASDAANLTYNWEQIDAGGEPCPGPKCYAQNGTAASYSDAGDPATTTRPIFRAFASSPNPTRIFPSLTYILNNGNVPPAMMGSDFFTAENLPAIGRTLNFAVTVRDNRASGGGINDDLVKLTVDGNSGPFKVTTPAPGSVIAVGGMTTVAWDVNNTNVAPVNAANVKITLSTDGGLTFPIVLAASVPNNGNANVSVPTGLNSVTARVKVEAIGNIFFDIMDGNFTLTSGGGCPALESVLPIAGGTGTVVTIKGSDFTGVTGVKFSNNVTATFTVVNDSTITTTVPAGAVSGPITLTKASCAATQTTSFTICTTSATGSVDDGTPESYGGGPSYFVNRITPTSYPATLSQVQVFFSDFVAPPVGTSFQIVVAANPGGGTNINNIPFQSIPATVQAQNQFNTYGVSPLTITSGDFLVGFVMATTQAVLPGAEDQTMPQSRSYTSSNGTAFDLKTDGNFLARAVYVTGCTAATCVTVTNAAPTSGAPGTPVTITGTGFIGVNSVRFGGGAAAQFTINSDTSLTAIVPAGATTGAITVSRPGCADAQTASFTVSAGTCPTVTGINPMVAAPGSTVTITGSGLLGVSVLKFGGNAGAIFTVVNDTTITATVPAGAIPGPLTLSKTGCSNVTTTASFQSCGTPLPLQVDNIGGPASANGGDDYTVNRVTPVGYPAVLTSVSVQFRSFQQVPLNAPITIVAGPNPGGTSTFSNIAFQTVNSTISVQGDFFTVTLPNPVTINSGDFIIGYRLLTGNFKVLLDPVAPQGRSYSSATGATFTPISDGNVPIRGLYNLSCAAPVPVCPTVANITPNSGVAGATVTITGTNFTGVTGVQFSNGIAAASFNVVNATTITAVIPATAVSGPLTLIKPSCNDAQTASFTVNQALPACQTVTNISPGSGLTNTAVTITGTNLSGVNQVIFTNGQSAQFTVASTTMITATVPLGATTGPITLKKPSCADVQTSSFTVQTPVCPTVTGFAPQNGAVGQEVTLTGTGFTPMTQVDFNNNQAAQVIFDSVTQIRAIVPAGATNGKLKLNQVNCPDVPTTQDFLVTSSCPTVAAVTPAVAAVGATVTITGTNFTDVTNVKFGGNVAAVPTIVDAVTMTVVVPAGASTSALTIEKLNCPDATSPTLTILAAGSCPTVTAINPKFGPVGSTITISGTNFTGVTTALFYNANGGTITATPNVVNNTTVTVVVPAGVVYQVITLQKPGCPDADTPSFFTCGTDFSLGVSDGVPENSVGGATHFVNRIMPPSYPATLNAVRLRFDASQNVPSGTNFTLLAATNDAGTTDIGTPTFQTKAVQVGTLGQFVTYTLTTPITINTGDFVVGFTGINVGTPALLDTTRPDGNSYESQDGTNFLVMTGDPNLLIDAQINVSCTPAACPTVTGFIPATGGFGTGILITGTNFTGVTAVKFSNNVPAANFTVMSDTEISAFVPANAVTTGPITISKPNCGDVQTGIFNACPFVAISPVMLNPATAGSPYTVTFTADPPFNAPNWAVTAGILPAGLSLNQFTGELSGTPTQAGTFMFAVTYSEAFTPCMYTLNYTLTVNPATGCPTITFLTPGLLPGKVGVGYIGSVAAMSTVPGAQFTFSLMSGTLPAGLTLAADGSITGTPTAAGTSANLVIKATDANNCSGTAAYSIVINPDTCADIMVGQFFQPPSGSAGAAYDATVPVDPPGTYTFAIAGGSLPAGLSLNTGTGQITGTPTAAGATSVSITATAAGCVGGNNFSIEICPTITITPGALAAGAVNVPYAQQLTSTPAADPVFGGWDIVVPGTGTLPPGLTLSQTGLLSGDPNTPGTFTFTVEVLIGGQCRAQKDYTLVIAAGGCPTIGISPTALSAGTEGTPFNNGGVALSATPAGTYTFTISAGAMPAGITLDSTTGAFSGTPTATGTFNFTVRATGAGNCTGERQYSLVINQTCPNIIINPVNGTLAAGTMGTPYTQTFTQTGSTAAITWSSTGTLPGGLTLNSTTGVLSGTPTMTGNFTFLVKATDANGCVGQREYLLATAAGCPTITVNPSNSTLTAGTVGTAYTNANLPFTQTGGTGTTAWDNPAGALPDGLTLNPTTGALTGTPTAPGTYSFTVRATVAGCTGQRQYTLTINPPGNGLQFYPLARPIRLLDTRAGQGNCDNVGAPVAAGTSITTLARITCEGITIPATAQAIVGNITAINGSGQSGFLTLFPAGQTLPLAANMIYTPGDILSNAFTVGLNANGEFNVFCERTIDIVVDISGYYAPPQPAGLYYHPLSKPIRLLDTRAGQGNCDSVSTPIAAGSSLATLARTTCETITIPAAAQAIVGNSTVINGSGQTGFLTIYPDGQALPLAANMVYFPGQILSNAFTVSLGANGKFSIFGERTIDMVIDVAGYYSNEATDVNGPGLLFTPLVRPLRLLDTRAGQGNCDSVSTPITGGDTLTTLARITCESITIPATAQTIIGNFTVINQTGQTGFLTIYPDGQPLPLAANMVYFPGQLLSNAFVVGLSNTGQFNVFGERTIHAIIDVSGYFAQ